MKWTPLYCQLCGLYHARFLCRPIPIASSTALLATDAFDLERRSEASRSRRCAALRALFSMVPSKRFDPWALPWAARRDLVVRRPPSPGVKAVLPALAVRAGGADFGLCLTLMRSRRPTCRRASTCRSSVALACPDRERDADSGFLRSDARPMSFMERRLRLWRCRGADAGR